MIKQLQITSGWRQPKDKGACDVCECDSHATRVSERNSRLMSDCLTKLRNWRSVHVVSDRVSKYVHCDDQRIVVAGKSVNVYNDASLSAKFKRVVKVMLKVDHVCVERIEYFSLPVLDGDVIKFLPHIFTRYIDSVSLRSILQNDSLGLDRTWASIIVAGVAFGMRHIHSHNIIVRNLSPDSIFVDDHGWPQINDFDYSIVENPMVSQTQMIGNAAYMAPEMCSLDEDYTNKVDVFSFGMILYEIIFRRKYLVGSHISIDGQCLDGVEESLDVSRFACARGVNTEVVDLIRASWAVNPAHRPTFVDIVKKLTLINFKLFDDVDTHRLRAFVDIVRKSEV